MAVRSSVFVEQRDWGDVAIVGVHGHLVAEAGPALTRAVSAALRRGLCRIVVNLADVITVDAAGLGELASVRRMIAERRGELRLIVARREVREPLALTRLLGAFQVFSSEADALASLTPAPAAPSPALTRTAACPGPTGRLSRLTR